MDKQDKQMDKDDGITIGWGTADVPEQSWLLEQLTAARAARDELIAELEAERARHPSATERIKNASRKGRLWGADKGPAKTQSTSEHGPGRPKTRQGLVVSSKADKTITVRVDTARRHRRYEKIVRSSSTLHAHDEANTANEGDLVTIIESRPLSRLKRWRLVEVLERAK